MAQKPSVFSRILGFLTGKQARAVEVQKERFESDVPRPMRLPTAMDFSLVSKDQRDRYNLTTTSLAELEWVVMDVTAPESVRREAVERWVALAPHPMKPMTPGLSHENWWYAFRDAYAEKEEW